MLMRKKWFIRVVVFTPLKYSKLRGQKIGKLLQNRVAGWCLKQIIHTISKWLHFEWWKHVLHTMLPLDYTEMTVEEWDTSGCVDLLLVKHSEQSLGRAQTATLSPSQQQQQTGQWLKLLLQKLFELRELLVFNQVKCSNLQEDTNLIT